jgi:hypothetical protein
MTFHLYVYISFSQFLAIDRFALEIFPLLQLVPIFYLLGLWWNLFIKIGLPQWDSGSLHFQLPRSMFSNRYFGGWPCAGGSDDHSTGIKGQRHAAGLYFILKLST